MTVSAPSDRADSNGNEHALDPKGDGYFHQEGRSHDAGQLLNEAQASSSDASTSAGSASSDQPGADRHPKHAPATETKRGYFVDAVVPPPSPAWFGAVMGSAILGTLSVQRTDVVPFGKGLGKVFWIIAVVLLIALVASFIGRILRNRAAFSASVATPVAMAQWGMVSMGILATGSATAAVLPLFASSQTHLAWRIDLWLWVSGTIIGLMTAAAVPGRLLVSEPSTPTTVWGLAVVPPMVSATVGAGIVGSLHSSAGKVWMILAAAGCFFIALMLGLILFAIAYRHHWLVEPLPLAASITAWLPLGVVGQSTAAAQSIAKVAHKQLLPAYAGTVQQIANVYGYVTLAIGIPLVCWALVMTVRGFMRRMPFSPGWWGMTFPVGTIVLGSTLLGKGSKHSWITDVGGGFYLFLLVTWSTCVVFSLLAIAKKR